MRIYPILLFILVSELLFSQYSAVKFTEKKIHQLADHSKQATLYVVVYNEKDPCDAALISAVKTYWKNGPHKLLSQTEYLDLKQKETLQTNNFYLYEVRDNLSTPTTTNALITSAILKNVHSGVYHLDFIANREISPKEKNKSLSTTEALTLSYSVSNALIYNKAKVLDGYYDLMIKYFNNEIVFCQKFSSLKDIKKEDKNGIIYFDNGMSDVLTRDILLTKEQVNKLTAAKAKEKKNNQALDAVAQFNEPKNVFTVYPEDIKLALSKSDKKVLIFSNGMLLSAENGGVVAAPNIYKGGKEKSDGFLIAAFAVLILAYGATFMVK